MQLIEKSTVVRISKGGVVAINGDLLDEYRGGAGLSVVVALSSLRGDDANANYKRWTAN